MKFDSNKNDILQKLANVNLQIQTMYEDIVDIIEEETSKPSWSVQERDLMRIFITSYKKDPWNFVENELDPLINKTTLDPRKLVTFNVDNIKNLKNAILNYTDY